MDKEEAVGKKTENGGKGRGRGEERWAESGEWE